MSDTTTTWSRHAPLPSLEMSNSAFFSIAVKSIGVTCETLVGVEYVGLAITGQRFLDWFNAEGCLHRDRQSPRQNPPAEPVHNGAEIDKSARYRNIGQVYRPDLIGSGNR